jgi:hypothetical protein
VQKQPGQGREPVVARYLKSHRAGRFACS